MGKFYDHLPDNLVEWARQQRMFWVATAPLSKDGHVNLSPKGCGLNFMSIDNKRVIYEDLSGSGIETISHIRENQRITLLFHAFEGPPRLCRIFGTGSYHEFGTLEYEAYLPEQKRSPGSRAIICIDIHKVGTSCGFGIPLYDYKADRPTLNNWASVLEKPDARAGSTMHDWWRDECTKSIDGLPALDAVLAKAGTPLQHNWTFKPITKKKLASQSASGNGNKGGSTSSSASGKLLAGGDIPRQLLELKNPAAILEDRMLNGIIIGVSLAALMFYTTKLLGIPL